PMQLLVVGFDNPDFRGKILQELDRLRESDIVRLVDLLVVQKDADGEVTRVQISDLSVDEAEEFGATVGALIGFGAAGEEGAIAGAEAGAEALREDPHVLGRDLQSAWYVDDVIPENTAAAIAILEHRWAIPLRESIRDANGFHLADAWIHPADLVAVGLLASEEAAAH